VKRILLLSAAFFLSGCAFAGPTSPGPSDSTSKASYTGTIHMPKITLQCGPTAGFGTRCSGELTLTFDPAPKAGLSILVRFDDSAMSGTAVSDGSTSMKITVGGDTLGCPFNLNPDTLVVQDRNKLDPVLAFIKFTWEPGGKCG
jgi:hypothetical protein